MSNNPIETVRKGPYHFEYRTYPEAALREALLNALCHADFRIASPRLVKQYPARIEISNPGGLVGDLTPENILHHPPAARNRCLVDALGRLRLINRMNLGMERIYSSLLMEGKPPPGGPSSAHGGNIVDTFQGEMYASGPGSKVWPFHSNPWREDRKC